jgi:hypothetical protein
MIDLGIHIERVARRLLGEPNKALSKRDELRFGSNGSLSVIVAGRERGAWYDHENKTGGGVREMLRANGHNTDDEAIAEWFRRELGIDVNPDQQHVVKTYDYVDETSALHYQVWRWGPQKFFSQHAPDGRGGFKRGKGAMDGVRRVLYRLDELLAAKAAANGEPWRVHICEGEKDVDRIRQQWRVVATCNPGGAGKWQNGFNEYFRNADVIVLQDNDDAGRKHAGQVAASIGRTAARVRIVELPGLPEKGDISDWIDGGGTQSDLEDLIDGTAPYDGNQFDSAENGNSGNGTANGHNPHSNGHDAEADFNSRIAGDPGPGSERRHILIGGPDGIFRDALGHQIIVREFDFGAPATAELILPRHDTAAQFELGEWDFGAAGIVAADLPPRGWLLGNWLCRQFVSALIGDGAGGKTALRIACALSLATGRSDILGLHVFERVPVLFLCFEDGEIELKRRICAAMLHHGICNQDIKGYLFVRAITNSELKLAVGGDYGKSERGPLAEALDQAIVRRQAAAAILDPLVKTHAVNENSNTAMDLVVEIFADIAIRRDVGVDLPHHVSKGPADPGNADRGRGGSAFKNGGRLVHTLAGMSADDAKRFKLSDDARLELVRVDPAKVNLVRRRSADTKWFRLVGVHLGNSWDPRFPHGDTVQTVEPWTPPASEPLLPSEIAEIFTALRAGPRPGEFYSANRHNSFWAGILIVKLTGKTEDEAADLLRDWIKNKVLTEGEYYSSQKHRRLTRVTLDEVKVREILGALYQPPEQAA